MNSEKVKEIKKGLSKEEIKEILKKRIENINPWETHALEYHKGLLDLINELESENERLNKSDTSKEESSIEYYNLYKDLKRKNKDLNELCELQRVSIAESFVRENQLKDRIAELEDKIENGTLIELPCKVGDKVWLIYENQVEIAEIWRIVLTPTYNEFKWFIPYDGTQPKDTGSFKTNEIGKTVFLTKAEAEAKSPKRQLTR